MKKLFELEKTLNGTKARAGKLYTSHGQIPTPVFMPVGTQGTVKAINQRDLGELGAKIILGNTYHLYLRPNDKIINKFGGLHKFINWDGAMLTDSGGYQIFSLKELRKLTEEGAEFKSYIDGSMHFFSPESVIQVQRNFGSDFVMSLDECTPYPAEKTVARKSMELSLRWAARCKEEFVASKPKYGKEQFLFAIGQGSMYPDLRKEYIEKALEIGFDAYAMGGMSVGEPAEMMYDITDISTDSLPKGKARYLMGVGTPENILESIDRGVDMFDCVMPTRNARNGQLFTTHGKINIRNAKYKLSDDCIDDGISSYASNNYSLGYMRHLFIANEILGLQIASMHNIAFYLWLTATAREKIIDGTFIQWKKETIEKMSSSKA